MFRLDIITDMHAVGFELICHHEANERTGPEGLPDALVITAENDVLRDKGEAYARKLWEAGVRVTCTRYIGTIRDFVMLNTIAELSKICGGTCKYRSSQIGLAFLHVGIGKSSIDLFVELLDNLRGRGFGHDDPVPASRLEARQKFAHGRDVRQRLLTLCGGHCQRAQLAGPDIPKRRRHDAEQELHLPLIRSGSASASPR